MARVHLRGLTAVSLAAAASILSAGSSSVARAQATSDAASDSGIEEITVTARRRSEGVQKVPISIAVFSTEALEARGIQTTEALNRQVPNVTIASDTFYGRDQGNFRMRGIRDVGIYVDGIAHQEVLGLLGNIVEMERVEVLRGPQGTLFGKGSMGGAIQYVTKKPSDTFGVRLKGSVGSYDRFDIQGIADIPISDTLLTKLTLAKLTRGGYLPSTTIQQRFGSQNDTVAQADLLWKPTDKLNWQWTLSRQDSRTSGSPTTVWKLDPTCVFPQPNLTCIYNGIGLKVDPAWVYGASKQYKTASNYNGADLYIKTRELATQVNYAIDERWALKALGNYRKLENVGYDDFDGTPYKIFDGKNYTTILEKTAELQLLFSGDRLIGTTGLYSYRDDRRFLRNNWFTNEIQRAVNPTLFAAAQRFLGIPSFVPIPPIVPNVHALTYFYAKGWAAFGEWTYKVTDQFSATAGVRYNKDQSSTRGFTPRDPLPVLCCEPVFTDQTNGGAPISSVAGDFTNTAPRVSLQYQWNPEVMTYLTYAEGFNRGGGTQTATGVVSFTPEKLKNIEAGVRSDLFDRHLRVNSSVFYSKYTGIQVIQDLNFFNVTRNAGEGTARGLEIEGQWLLGDAFSVNYGLGYLKTEYTKLAAGVTDPKKGQVFPFAPKYSASVGAQYDIHVANGGGVALRADYGWQDDQNTGVDSSSVFIPAYGLLSARVTYRGPDEKWDAALYGTNLANEFYRLNGYAIPSLGLDTGTTGRPREWGLTFNFRLN